MVPLLSTTLRPQLRPWELVLSVACSSLARLDPGVGGTNRVVEYLASPWVWFLLNHWLDFLSLLLFSCSVAEPLGLLMGLSIESLECSSFWYALSPSLITFPLTAGLYPDCLSLRLNSVRCLALVDQGSKGQVFLRILKVSCLKVISLLVQE